MDQMSQSDDEANLATLIAQLRDPNWTISQAGADRLVQLKEAAVPALIKELWNPESEVRRRAALALGQIGDESAVEPLIDVLDAAEDNLVRWAAAVALGDLADSTAIPSLISVLGNEGWHAGAASEALVKIGKPAVLPLLNKLSDADYRVRRYAARALSELPDRRASKLLIAALDDEDTWVRFSAAEGLGAIGERDAVNPLISLLQHEESEVRGAAATALGKIGDPQALPALEQLEGDTGWTADDRAVEDVALEAITLIREHAK